MVYITEELVRRRAEHNGGEISSLEELSLHQQDLESIQHLQRWSRELRILYLQSNLIPRIENVGRLKKLQYLNLALNNIEVIENLEGCESLEKLDLTVNFVVLLSGVVSLQQNLQLRELFLVGNPCSQFEGYRQYVVATLPQLKWLDGVEVSRSERLRACWGLEEVRRRVREQEEEHLERRAAQKEEARKEKGDEERKPGRGGGPASEENQEEEERREEEFWHTPCAFTPESRLEAHRHLKEKKEKKEKEKPPPNDLHLMTSTPLRHMDSSLVDVDVQPTYARVTVKGKVFQMVLPAEVKPDSSTARRSQTTGHLVLTMPRAEGEIKVTEVVPRPACPTSSSPADHERRPVGGPEWLEVDPSRSTAVHLANIVRRRSAEQAPPTATPRHAISDGFVDDPDVPPLL
ncbi:dynein axonemal assembly factor 11 [Pseudoliparis swirei]|uniref:dynein axonemal assembly factor 11 n=1 Tax=Pseudoliparis swirei TaxID=2059687 RepID=UPI0024BE5070|nr:dynein axonemal assembly factor 11 [Pseudoliparis swirei]